MSLFSSRAGRDLVLMAFAFGASALFARPSLGQGLVPNDIRYVQQWALHTIDAELAWSITTGTTEVTVAVTDTGVDYTHPDLYLNVWINQGEIPSTIAPALIDIDGDGLITFWDLEYPCNQGVGLANDVDGNGRVDGRDLLADWADGIDNEGNGFADDLVGWDFFEDDNDPMDLDGHGTKCAGIIGARGDNGEGIAGINWKSRIQPVRFAVRPARFATPEELAQAIAVFPSAMAYAADNGARVNSLSGGLPENAVPPQTIADTEAVIQQAALAGQLVVCAAGNSSHDNDTFPAFLPASLTCDNIVSVAATELNETMASFSSYGFVSVDLGAPGRLVWTTEPEAIPGVDYFWFTGTSAATPHVAGAAALILSVDPTLDYAEVKAHILNSVDPLSELNGITVTGGRLNLFGAVSLALP